jgi:hypothetical protein
MSEESYQTAEPTFSAFIPLTILLLSFILWFAVQDYQLNNQHSNMLNQLDTTNAYPPETLKEALLYKQRYLSLIQDLDHTAQNDETAKAILADALKGGLINDAIKVGLINVQQNPAPAPQK